MYTCGFALWISQLITNIYSCGLLYNPLLNSLIHMYVYLFGHNVQVIHRHYNIVTSYANTYNVYNSIEPKFETLVYQGSLKELPPATSSFCCCLGRSTPTYKSLLLKIVCDKHLFQKKSILPLWKISSTLKVKLFNILKIIPCKCHKLLKP